MTNIINKIEFLLGEDHWIANAIKRPGQLHRDLGVATDKKIPAKKLKSAAKKPGKIGQRARLAMTLKKLHHN